MIKSTGNMDELRQKILDLLKEEFGEYSHFEVKEQVAWNTLEKKAEFIKDIQSLCNSLSDEPARYLVIGYNKHKKVFEEVENYQDFDDGKLVTLLSAYFDPEITFKTHAFTSDDGKHFVVIEFPKDKLAPPHLIKKEMKGQGKEVYLNLGEIWIKGGGKGGSSSKRRATRDDLYEMFDLYIEQLTEKRTQIRVSEAIKVKQVGILAKELILPENFDSSLIYKEDEVFINITKQLILGEKSTYLRELVEDLRQNLLSAWKQTKHDGNNPPELEKLNDLAYDAKINKIQPSMRKLVLLGTQLVKTRSYPSIFDRLLEIIAELYAFGYRPEFGVQTTQNIKRPNENLSYNLPALESITAFNLLGAYAIKINNLVYLSKLLNLKTKWKDGYESRFMIFQHPTGEEEYTVVPELRNTDGRTHKNLVNYYSERGNYLIPYAFDDADELITWLACYDLIIELNSQALIHTWEAQKKLRLAELEKAKAQLPEGTAEHRVNELSDEILGEYNYWRSPFTYFAHILNLNSERIVPILERLKSLYEQKRYDELKSYFVTDKHNILNYQEFDKFLYEGTEDIKRQRDQSFHFASFFGWFGKDIDTFLKVTAKKYNIV